MFYFTNNWLYSGVWFILLAVSIDGFLLTTAGTQTTGTLGLCDDNQTNCQFLDDTFDVCNDVMKARTLCQSYCDLCNIVDGGWSAWATSSACDVTCGNGTQTMTRSCTNPAAVHGGLDCVGSSSEQHMCVLDTCPVHGHWGEWTNWGSCSSSCGFGLRRRDRVCDNPWPSKDGSPCLDDNINYEQCVGSTCSVGWTDWGSWGGCSVTCGPGGTKHRTRSCQNPLVSLILGNCQGETQEITNCTMAHCPSIAFTAYTLVNAPAAGVLTFSRIVINEGNGFNKATGEFTCTIPGLYSFTFHLVKKRSPSVDAAGCTLLENGNDVGIWAYIDPQDGATGADNGSYGVSNSAYLRLAVGDKVRLGDCYPATSFETRSSFSGVLIKAD